VCVCVCSCHTHTVCRACTGVYVTHTQYVARVQVSKADEYTKLNLNQPLNCVCARACVQVSKAEDYNTKKPELLGYEEMRQMDPSVLASGTTAFRVFPPPSCWVTRK
jgi:hypothetical protein